MDPLEPIDRMDPLEPMDRIDPLDAMLRSDPRSLDPAGSAAPEVPTSAFWHRDLPPAVGARF
jgi:hypothetical protein